MNNQECQETEKWYGKNTKIIDVHSCTWICSSTTKWIIYDIFANQIWLLEDIMKELKKHPWYSDDVDVP